MNNGSGAELHEEPEPDDDPKQEEKENKDVEEDGVINVHAPRQTNGKRHVVEVVDLTEPGTKTKSSWKKKRKVLRNAASTGNEPTATAPGTV